MPWKQKVARGFGDRDAVFASHPIDEKCAKDTIKEAKSAGATFEDFEKEIVWHVYKNVTAPGEQQEHIAAQVRTAKKLWG